MTAGRKQKWNLNLFSTNSKACASSLFHSASHPQSSLKKALSSAGRNYFCLQWETSSERMLLANQYIARQEFKPRSVWLLSFLPLYPVDKANERNEKRPPLKATGLYFKICQYSCGIKCFGALNQAEYTTWKYPCENHYVFGCWV